MLCLGLFFLKALIDVIGFGVLDKAEILLFSAKNIAVIILGFIAYGVYFQVQNKPSIFFLIAVVSISFSCIIDYLILSSSNHWVYSVLSRMTYLSGLYFIFQYPDGGSIRGCIWNFNGIWDVISQYSALFVVSADTDQGKIPGIFLWSL